MALEQAKPPMPVTPVQAAIGVVASIPLLVPYLAAGWALGASSHIFMGFIFAIYWTVMKAMALEEYLPSVLGCLGGLATGFLLFALPPMIGTAGYVIAGAVIVTALFLFNLGALTVLVNPAYLIMLTLGTTPFFKAQADYAAAATAILLAAGYAGGMVLLVTRIAKARSRAVVTEIVTP